MLTVSTRMSSAAFFPPSTRNDDDAVLYSMFIYSIHREMFSQNVHHYLISNIHDTYIGLRKFDVFVHSFIRHAGTKNVATSNNEQQHAKCFRHP